MNIKYRRMFLALWPTSVAIEQLKALETGWHWPAEVTLYQPCDWHVTLHFIGLVPQDTVENIANGLNVPFAPFEMKLNRASLWPHGLAVLTDESPADGLSDLHMRLAHALRALNLPVDTRPFQPHLTLARKAQTATTPESFNPVCWKIDNYALVESTGLPHQRYRIVQRYTAMA